MTLSAILKTTQTFACVYGFINPTLVCFCCKRVQYDSYRLYGKGRTTCVPKKTLVSHRVLPAEWYHKLCFHWCSPLPYCYIIAWVIIIVYSLVLGILFRFIDIPIALINIFTCYWQHDWRFDIVPVAGESYVKYMICCGLSLLVNAFCPADMDSVIGDPGASCDLCQTFFEALIDDCMDCVEGTELAKDKRMRKCESENVMKYYDDFYVLHRDPLKILTLQQKDDDGCCCELVVNEDDLYSRSENKKFADGNVENV